MATLLYDYPLSTNFTGVYQLQSQGIIDTGANYPNGITDRIVIENGIMRSKIVDTDTITATGIRSEIVAPVQTRAEFWYAFEFMVPPTWNYTGNNAMSLMQIHDTPDGGDAGRWPNFWLAVDKGLLVTSIPAATLPAESLTGQTPSRIDLVKGKWYRAVLHVNWQIDTTGYMEFFIDRMRQFTLPAKATHYDDVTGPYMKLGVYDTTHNAGFGTLEAYYRGMKVYSGAAAHTEILGGPQILPKRLVGTY